MDENQEKLEQNEKKKNIPLSEVLDGDALESVKEDGDTENKPAGEDFGSGSEPDESMPGSELDEESFKSAVEAVLFASDKPLSARKLAEIIGAGDGRKVRSAIKQLQKEYAATRHAFQIEEIAGGYQMFTLPEYHPWVKRLGKATKEEKLSQAALETLAIIAYKQPILRADIEAIRGVQCGPILRALIERGLVKVAGKSEELGRPLLYGTTKKFLQVFGLRSLRDLPHAEELLRRPEQKTAQAENAAEAEADAPNNEENTDAPQTEETQ